MTLIPEKDRPTVRAIGQLTYCNPFLEERIRLERQVLGDEFTPFDAVWHPREDVDDDNPNVLLIAERAAPLVEAIRTRLVSGERATDTERGLYQDLCLYVLFYRWQVRIFEMLDRPQSGGSGHTAEFYPEFAAEAKRLLDDVGMGLPAGQPPEHLFACFYQVRRAFKYTFRAMAGGSLPTARLRSQVWQSIFTHDLRRYQRSVYRNIGDVTTLITGPSGAGKELVARAIGLSRYIPFDPVKCRFRESFEESFFALNLSALSPTLIESELFGHQRGAFTGAVADRKGWLEVCPPLGAVFLDEIGEVDASIQVKLLRVLETRTFQQLGSSEDRTFRGKVIAATNRDLAREMREGRFREDLYYRLCADTVTAPSLRDRIADSPGELSTLIWVLSSRLVGEEEAAGLAEEAESWIRDNLVPDYAWPGNVRELSQCVSNVLIHRNYRPVATEVPSAPLDRLAAEFLGAELSAEEMLRRYCTLVFDRTGSYVQAAERLELDRRTVKGRVDPELLARLRESR